ncbi:hypothetical protein F4801DRAFT_579776 [Xylaria longipes]|nr:hypothetical protein F4801DRAFT_579776 [Xylaria longipes]
MSTPTPPIPIVLVGIHTEIGEPVASGLRPDFDGTSLPPFPSPSPLHPPLATTNPSRPTVIRFIQTFAAAQSDLPYLLRGESPPDAATNTVGSGDFSRGPARAVLFGRGFSQRQAEELYAANKTAAEGVVWVAGDEAKRPAGFEPPPGIEKVMVPIFRGALEKWVEEGGKGGLVLY